MVEQTLAVSKNRFEHFTDPELYRLRGECAVEMGDTQVGLAWLRQAQILAATRGASLFELRAITAILEQSSDEVLAQRLSALHGELVEGIGAADRDRASQVLAGL